MKKVFFLTNTVDLTSSSDGLAKKIHSQVKAFQECGYITELAGCSGKFYKIEDHQFSIEETGVFSKTNEMLKLLEEYILKQEKFEHYTLQNDLNVFLSSSDVILANRVSKELEQVSSKIYTRDLFGEN